MATSNPSGPIRVDVEQFASLAAAIATIHRDRAFDDIAKTVLSAYFDRGGEWSMLFAFFGSAVTRARGTHEAIVREIGESNAHAVFPLLRQFAETVALVFYVADHPDYVLAVATRPRDQAPSTPRRKSIQALANYMDRYHTQQFKLVWDELCEITHFGSSAMWTSHQFVADGDDLKTQWSSAPRWSDEREAKLACGWLLELSTGMDAALRALGETLVSTI